MPSPRWPLRAVVAVSVVALIGAMHWTWTPTSGLARIGGEDNKILETHAAGAHASKELPSAPETLKALVENHERPNAAAPASPGATATAAAAAAVNAAPATAKAGATTDAEPSGNLDVAIWVASNFGYDTSVELGPNKATPRPTVSDETCKHLLGPASRLRGPADPKAPKVYDTVMFNTEFTMLEIRLHELWNVVDKFIIVEAGVSHTGQPKPFHFDRHRDVFAPFASKIIHVKLPTLEGDSSWPRENFHRIALTTTGMANVTLAPGDVVLVSDLDELPRPEVLEAMRQCLGAVYPICFNAQLTYYAYDFLMINEWKNPRAMAVQDNGQLPCTGQALRANEAPKCACAHVLPFPTAWHCSWCFKVIEQYVNKVKSYAHTEYAIPRLYDPAFLKNAVLSGTDIHDRKDLQFRQLNKPEAPAYVMNHPDRFQWILYRTKKFAAP